MKDLYIILWQELGVILLAISVYLGICVRGNIGNMYLLSLIFVLLPIKIYFKIPSLFNEDKYYK